MIHLRKSTARHYVRTGALEIWTTFDPANRADPLHEGFRALETLNEVHLPPENEVHPPAGGWS